jgi:ABC-type branched-subunit amino acid transport system substrate-binding protein
MIIQRRKVLIGAALIVASVASIGLAHAQSPAPFKLGFIASMTGPQSQSGFNGLAGVNLAVKEINARGGIMGRQVQVLVADDQSDPTAAVGEMRRLVQREKVDAVAGPMASQLTLATLPIVTEAKMASVSISGSSAINPQIGPYHFSLLPSSDAQSQGIAHHLDSVLHAKSVAIIHDAGAQSRAIAEGLRAELKKRNIEVTAQQEYAATDTDMTPALLSMRRTRPDALVASVATGNDIGYIIKNLGEMGWGVKVVGNMNVVIAPAVTTKVAGPDAYKNAIGLAYNSLTYCKNDAAGSSDFAKFKQRLQGEVGDKFPQYSPVLAGMLYDIVYVLKAGLEGAKKTDGPSFAAWMEQNAASVKVTSGNLFASKTNHFLIGASALGLAEDADKIRSDGLTKRAGC